MKTVEREEEALHEIIKSLDYLAGADINCTAYKAARLIEELLKSNKEKSYKRKNASFGRKYNNG